MESCTVSGYEVIVCEPAAQSSRVGVLLNDGEIAEKLSSMCEDVWLFGVVPRDRLNDYTPWPAAAMRKGAPDFGGGCESYTGHLTEGVLPLLSEKYGIGKWIYGGHSLGGLAAGKRPRRRCPCKEPGVLALYLKAGDGGALLHVLIALGHLVAGKRRPAARAVGHNLKALVEQALVPDFL